MKYKETRTRDFPNESLHLIKLFFALQTTLASVVQRGTRDAADPEVQRREDEDDSLDHGDVDVLNAKNIRSDTTILLKFKVQKIEEFFTYK